jgi:hypothetical protein
MVAQKFLNSTLCVRYLSCHALINNFLNAIPKSLYVQTYLRLSVLHWNAYGIFLNPPYKACDNQVLRMLTYELYLIRVDCSS